MTKRKKRQWIKACKKLLIYYERGTEDQGCPFCGIAGWIKGNTKLPRRPNCEKCIWKIFTGKRCFDYVCKKYGDLFNVAELRQDPPEIWRVISIERLNRWIKRLESE